MRVCLYMLQQPVSIAGHPEKISLFSNQIDRPTAVGAILIVLQLTFLPVGLARGTVPAFVFTLVDITLFIKTGENLLDLFIVARLGSADKIIVRDVKLVPELFDPGHYFIDEFLRLLTRRRRLPLYFLPVFIGSRKKVDLKTG